MANRPDGDHIPGEREYYRLVRKAFAFLAPVYDASGLALSRMRGRVVGFAAPATGDRILDVATGTGKQAMAFAERGFDTVGIDLSDAMLRVALRKSRSAKAHFVMADAASLPFGDGIFDVSSVSFGLHEMPLTVMRRTLAEMVRVTKKHGQVVVVDYTLPDSRLGRFLVYHFVKLYEGKYYAQFIKLDLRRLLAESGIRVTDERPAILGAATMKKGTRE